MYKLLIVEDNPWEREGLITVVNWNKFDISVVGTCSDGVEALENMKTLQPDIIMTDISMPKMDGIKLAAKIKEYGYNCKIIFMSSYNEFDFARSAIDLDVYAYILKPINRKDLIKAIEKVLDVFFAEKSKILEQEELLRQVNASIPVLRKQFLRDLFYGIYNDSQDIVSCFNFLKIPVHTYKKIQVIVMTISNYDDIIGPMSVENKYITTFAIERIIQSINETTSKILYIQTAINQFSLIFFMTDDAITMDDSYILESLVEIKEKISEQLNLNTVIGISNTSDNITSISKLYKQALDAVNTKFYSNNDHIVTYNEIESSKNSQLLENINLHELYKELDSLISYGSSNDINGFIDKYIGIKSVICTESYIKSMIFTITDVVQILLVNSNETFKSIFGQELLIWDKLDKFDTIKDIRQWIYNVLFSVKDYLKSKNVSTVIQVVQKIKVIIESRFNEQLTVNDIIKEIYFSALHANNIFKNETGMSIFDYLTEYRIEKAKQLLKLPNSRIYLVTNQVGYINKSHFCMVFKKYTGLTPGEYKEKAVL